MTSEKAWNDMLPTLLNVPEALKRLPQAFFFRKSSKITFSPRSTKNGMFVRLGTDYEIRDGGYFKTIKNSADQSQYGNFQMARIVEDS